MPQFGLKSKERLASCHPDLQRLFNEVIKHVDCTIVCGHRNQEDQDEAYRTGKSKVQWPDGKHNKKPSEAVDAVPCYNGTIDWNYLPNFYYFAGIVKGIALQMGIKLRWGGDWNSNMDMRDNKFNDLPHYELVLDDKEATIES